MLDTEGHVASWNEGARRLNGYRQLEILGQHVSVFHLQEDIEPGKPKRELRVAEAELSTRKKAEAKMAQNSGQAFHPWLYEMIPGDYTVSPT